MDLHGIRIVDIEGTSVVIADGRLVNVLTSRFTERYLPRLVNDFQKRRESLQAIERYFEGKPKDHFLRKKIIAIGDSEIPGVKEGKLNVCAICYGHCGQMNINGHLKKEHGIRKLFGFHVFKTTGYAIPTVKHEKTFLYRKPKNSVDRVDMSFESTPVESNEKDRFLALIEGHSYLGKGYTKYLGDEDPDESARVMQAIREHMMKSRPHLTGSSEIFYKMHGRGLMKSEYLSSTQYMYAGHAGKFFYTFAKYSQDPVFAEAVADPSEVKVVRAMLELVEKYLIVDEDPSGKLMQAVFITLLASEDRFAASRVRAKIFDGINYGFRLALADYMHLKRKTKEVLRMLDESVYIRAFEYYRRRHQEFNATLPAFDLEEDDNDPRLIMIRNTRFRVSDMSKLVRVLIAEYRQKVRELLPDGIMMVDEFYEMFKERAQDKISCIDRGYSVFFETEEVMEVCERALQRYRQALGAKWDDGQYMRSKQRELSELNLNLFVCMLLTCGSPYRVSELLTLTFANPSELVRTMYFSRGRIQLHILYSKTHQSSMKYARSTKVLPIEVSKNVVHYISVVRYLEVAIHEMHGDFPEANGEQEGEEEEEDEEDEEEEEDEEGREEERQGDDGVVETEAGVDDADIKRKLMKEVVRRSVFLRGPELRKGSQVFPYLRDVSNKYLKETYTPRILRQALSHFTRVLLRNFASQQTDLLNQIDSLAGHTTAVADAQYGVTHRNEYLTSTARMEIDRTLSLRWHEILELNDEGDKPEEKVDMREYILECIRKANIGSRETEAVGRRLYGDEFEFVTVKQLCAVFDSVVSLEDMLVVSPTGTGKSNLYKMPILAEKRMNLPFVSFVICPFISLLEDVKIKMGELPELVVELFDEQKGFEHYMHCDVIILQLEKVGHAEGLIKFFESGISSKCIRRLVLDEAHAFVEHRTFRGGAIARVPEQFGRNIPKVLLSATVPKSMEQQLKSTFGIRSWRKFREPTVRRNIEHVVFQGQCSMPEAVRLIYENEIRPANTRGIVFVYKRSLAEEIGKALGWPVFHGEMQPEQKEQVYQEFASTEGSMVVATSAFSHGVDVRKVSHVITIGMVSSIIDFQQVVGRMWRGEPEKIGKSYVILLPYLKNGELSGEVCVNQALSRALDDDGVQSCTGMGCVACSVCDASKRVTEFRRAPRITEVAEEAADEMAVDAEAEDPWTKLRRCEFNILRMYEMGEEDVGRSLGCWSEHWLATVFAPYAVNEEEFCAGCLLWNRVARSMDSEHDQVNRKCKLKPLMQAVVLALLQNKCDGGDEWRKAETAMEKGYVTGFMRRRYEDVVLRKEKYAGIFRRMMAGENVKVERKRIDQYVVGEVSHFLKSSKVSVERMMELVGGSGSIKVNGILRRSISRCSPRRMLDVNGVKHPYCFKCWAKFCYGDACRAGFVGAVLVESFLGGLELEEYFQERQVRFFSPTVCHFVDQMVYIPTNGVPLYFDFIQWMMYRYQDKIDEMAE